MRVAIVRFASWSGGYPMAAVSVVGLALVCLPLRGHLPLPAVMLVFVPLIVAIARLAGAGVSSFASVLAVLILDLLFVQPYYRFTVAEPSEWIALAVFVVVSVITGRQTALLRERERAALERQRQLALLNRLSASVVSEKVAASTAALTARQVAQTLGGGRVAIYAATEDSEGELLAEAGEPHEDGEQAFVAWVLTSGKAIGLPADLATSSEPRPVSVTATAALPGRHAKSVYLPLQSTARLEGVLVARVEGDTDETRAASFLVGVANIAALAFERERLEAEAARLIAEHEADRLKSTFVSSVSHELKTPLAAATARITGLLEAGSELPVPVHAEVLEVSSDLDRLNRSIGDLLDVSRLESDAWRPRLEVYEVPEILGSLIDRLPPAQRERVHFEIPAQAPSVDVDFNQVARALSDVVTNALQYSPAGSPVSVVVTEADGEARIAVSDRGPGVPDAEKERVFDKFFRGATSSHVQSGTGLGLAIAAEIVRVHGGRIWVEDADGGGARFMIALPVAEEDIRDHS